MNSDYLKINNLMMVEKEGEIGGEDII
jgi:hypothetical protein